VASNPAGITQLEGGHGLFGLTAIYPQAEVTTKPQFGGEEKTTSGEDNIWTLRVHSLLATATLTKR